MHRSGLAGGTAAVLSAAVLLGGAVALIVGSPGLVPWLAALFAISAGASGMTLLSLRVVSPVDITLLLLSALAFAGFWPGPGRPHRIWMGLAVALPLAGIGVLFATHLAGRSGLMGGGLVLSVLMLVAAAHRGLGAAGVAANGLLLVGDFATSGARIPVVAGLVAIGYLLLIAWFALSAASLLGWGWHGPRHTCPRFLNVDLPADGP